MPQVIHPKREPKLPHEGNAQKKKYKCEKPEKCALCGVQFASRSNLIKHQNRFNHAPTAPAGETQQIDEQENATDDDFVRPKANKSSLKEATKHLTGKGRMPIAGQPKSSESDLPSVSMLGENANIQNASQFVRSRKSHENEIEIGSTHEENLASVILSHNNLVSSNKTSSRVVRSRNSSKSKNDVEFTDKESFPSVSLLSSGKRKAHKRKSQENNDVTDFILYCDSCQSEQTQKHIAPYLFYFIYLFLVYLCKMPDKKSLRSQKNQPRASFIQKCDSCAEIINKNDTFLKCCECFCVHHIECINVSQKQYREIKKKTEWLCDEHDNDDDNDENQYQIVKKLDSIAKQLKDITKSQEFFSSQHDDVIDQLKKIREENKGARQEIASLKNQQHQMRSEIDQLKAKINIVEQNKTGDKIIVRGINKNENAKEAIVKIAGIVGVTLDANDIVFANQSTAENKAPTITAKFSSQQKKMNLSKQQKKNVYRRECMGILVTASQYSWTSNSPNTHTRYSHKQSS